MRRRALSTAAANAPARANCGRGATSDHRNKGGTSLAPRHVRVTRVRTRDDTDLMDPDSPRDLPGADSTDSASTPDASEVVPAGAEALSGSVPIEALPPPAPIDQVLCQPIPAEALNGTDPVEILSASIDVDPGAEIVVPS